MFTIYADKGTKIEGEAQEGTILEIVPGRNDVDLRRVHVGDRIWKTNDPALDQQTSRFV